MRHPSDGGEQKQFVACHLTFSHPFQRHRQSGTRLRVVGGDSTEVWEIAASTSKVCRKFRWSSISEPGGRCSSLLIRPTTPFFAGLSSNIPPREPEVGTKYQDISRLVPSPSSFASSVLLRVRSARARSSLAFDKATDPRNCTDSSPSHFSQPNVTRYRLDTGYGDELFIVELLQSRWPLGFPPKVWRKRRWSMQYLGELAVMTMQDWAGLHF